MTTNVTIIGDALRLLGVIAESQSVSSNQGSHALRVLNQMLEAWIESEIDLGWYEQTSTSDTAPLPKWAERGVTSKLAQALQPTYPASSLAPAVFDDDTNGYGLILREAIKSAMKEADASHLPVGSGHLGYYDDITR